MRMVPAATVLLLACVAVVVALVGWRVLSSPTGGGGAASSDPGAQAPDASSVDLAPHGGSRRKAANAVVFGPTSAAARGVASRGEVSARVVEYPSEHPLPGIRLRALDRELVVDAAGRLSIPDRTLAWLRCAEPNISILTVDDGNRVGPNADPLVWCVRTRTLRGTVVFKPAPKESTTATVVPILVGDDLLDLQSDASRPGTRSWLESRGLSRAFDEVVVGADGSFGIDVPDLVSVMLRAAADGYQSTHVDVGSSPASVTVEIRRHVLVCGRVRTTDFDQFVREGRDPPPIAVTIASRLRVSSLERAAMATEQRSRTYRALRRRDRDGDVIQTTQWTVTDGDGRFCVEMPPADAASLVVAGRTDSRLDLGKIEADRFVEVALPERAFPIRRIRFLERGQPLVGVVDVHHIVDDVDLYDGYGTGVDGEIPLPVRDGQEYVLRVWDQAYHTSLGPRFVKRWTAGPESVVDIFTLPDVPTDER